MLVVEAAIMAKEAFYIGKSEVLHVCSTSFKYAFLFSFVNGVLKCT